MVHAKFLVLSGLAGTGFGQSYQQQWSRGRRSQPGNNGPVGHRNPNVLGSRQNVQDVMPKSYVHPHALPLSQSRYRRGGSTSLLQQGVGSGAVCQFPFEVLIVQDSTWSFSDDYPNMISTQLSAMYNGIMSEHPGSTFGVVTHTDKPIIPYGWPAGAETDADYCFRVEQPLQTGLDVLQETYSRLVATGGNDPNEDQYTAIIAARQSTQIGWGRTAGAIKLMVVVTDAAPHFDGDGWPKESMSAYSGHFDEAHNDQQCVDQFYPTPDQAVSVIAESDTYMAFLIYDESGDGSVRGAWEWYAAAIGENSSFVADREQTSSNFWNQLSGIIGIIDAIECGRNGPVPPSGPTTPKPTVAPGPTTPKPTASPTQTPSPVDPCEKVVTCIEMCFAQDTGCYNSLHSSNAFRANSPSGVISPTPSAAPSTSSGSGGWSFKKLFGF